MQQTASARIIQPVRLVLLAALAVGLIYYIAVSIHWPIVWDAAVMHYVNFLMEHGMRPYQEITDSNMPGAYITESVAMHLFGRGDVAWRVYDLFLCGALTAATVVIAWPYDWLAGLYAGIFFTLFHGSDGPRFTGERDLVMTVLLVCGLAFLISALRRWRPVWMLAFGFAMAMAASIKPTSAPLALILLIAAAVLVWKQNRSPAAYLGWALVGFSLATLAVLGFLLQYHALHAFLFITRDMLPSYVSLRQLGASELIRSILPHSIELLAGLAAVLAIINRKWDVERWLVFACLVFGAVSYFAQRKGFPYHRYPLLAFLFLLISLEFLLGLRRAGVSRAIAAFGLAVFVLVSEPHLLKPMPAQSTAFPINFSDALSADLRAMGTDRLQKNIQCYDLTYGCFSALYRLGILQSNGLTGDLLLFSPTRTPAVDFYRNMLWRLDARDPPDVLVITNQWFQEENSFAKLKAWPEFARYLDANYSLAVSRSFAASSLPPGTHDPPLPAYRIYVRRGSPMLHLESKGGGRLGLLLSSPRAGAW